MAFNPRPAAGTKLYVCPDAPGAVTASGYAALSWTVVEGVESLPDIGPEANTITFDDMGTGEQVLLRGSENPGQPDVTIADDPADPGQVLIKAAFDAAKGTAAENLSVRIEDEAGNGNYGQVKIGAWRRSYGGSNSVIQRSSRMLFIQGTQIEYAA